MRFFKYLNIAKMVIDGVRAVVRAVRKDKPKNRFERVLEDIDDVTDVIAIPSESENDRV
tara:strand:+ start:29744 stop:29920 length:177 start_codon:yes stop_codon:yes gene_type:complete